MHLAFDIFQGMGIAAAVGIRPFLPALVAGALAAGSIAIHFNGTDFSFLQSVPFLIGMGVATVALLLAERSLTSPRPRAAIAIVIVCALALGALFFAGSLARGRYTAWPGLVGGIVCAAVAAAASLPLLTRAGARLRGADASALPLYAEGAAALVALLSVVAPPVGIIAVLLLVWLLLAGRRREEQKYAGLRILR